MRLHINTDFINKTATQQIPPQNTPGGQAMAMAAQMAAPAGAPPLPKPVEQQQPNSSDAALESKFRKDIETKDKEIASLRQKVQEAELNAKQIQIRSDIQAQQHAMLDNIKKEQAHLDKKQLEFAAAETEQKTRLAEEAAKYRVALAKEESKTLSNIAKRDADSIKATADTNAKAYIKMVDDSRKAADAYMNDRQNAFNKKIQETKKTSPYIPVALQTQLKGALAAANNVGKLRQRLSTQQLKIASSTASYQAPQKTTPGLSSPTTQKPQTASQILPTVQPPSKAITTPQPETPITKQQKNTASNPVSANSIPDNNSLYLGAKEQNELQNMAFFSAGTRVGEGNNLLDKQKAWLTATGKVQQLKAMQNRTPEQEQELKNWESALNIAHKKFNDYKIALEAKIKNKTATSAEQEEYAKYKDFNSAHERSGRATWLRAANPLNAFLSLGGLFVGGEKDKKTNETAYERLSRELSSFGTSDYRTDANFYVEAVRNGMTPEQYLEHLNRNKGIINRVGDFVLGSLDSLGSTINDNAMARQMAANRNIKRNWWSDNYSDQGAAGQGYLDAIKERGLKHSILGNAGNIALASGLAALDTAATIASAGMAGAATKAAIAAANAVRTAARAARLARTSGAAFDVAKTGLKQGWQAGNEMVTNFMKPVTSSSIGKAYSSLAKNQLINRAGLFDLGTSAAALGGTAAGINGAQYISPRSFMTAGQANQVDGGLRLTPSGYAIDAAGRLYTPADNFNKPISVGQAYGLNGQNGLTGGAYMHQNLKNYQMENPYWRQDMFHGPTIGLQKAGSAIIGSSEWNKFNNRDIYKDTPFTRRNYVGTALELLAPTVSNATGGVIKLAPSYKIPHINKQPINIPGLLSEMSTQEHNPLFNNDNGFKTPFSKFLEQRRLAMMNSLHPSFAL